MIVMWFSRQREFRADAGGARLAGRGSMISAPEGLGRAQGERVHMPQALQAFGIAGGRVTGFKLLFMSHPPLQERIAALQRGG
jgi:heat shock protein HtpX